KPYLQGSDIRLSPPLADSSLTYALDYYALSNTNRKIAIWRTILHTRFWHKVFNENRYLQKRRSLSVKNTACAVSEFLCFGSTLS
ncbi:MAG: hypothetical protein KC546_23270, partial [Anaerolineae bacterium]|nr:hypothetical protein [Anaerolineae bacterium]